MVENLFWQPGRASFVLPSYLKFFSHKTWTLCSLFLAHPSPTNASLFYRAAPNHLIQDLVIFFLNFSLRSSLNCKLCPTGEQVKPPTLGVHYHYVPSSTLFWTWYKIHAQRMQAMLCFFSRIFPWLQHWWDAAYVRLKLPRSKVDFDGPRKAL